jgi:hypothetical protein
MEKVILNNNLEAGTYPHRAVLLREPADKYAPNGNGDLIAIEYKFEGEWEQTPGRWYAETLLGTCEHARGGVPTDGISIMGDDWVVEAGMIDALKAYVRILIDEGNFMTDERQAKVADIRQRQKKIFGDDMVETSEEDILACYSKWGAA